MILTVTMNPSIDMAYELDHLKLDSVNRASSVNKTAGGKGLNVTRVIHQMKEPVIASGLLGGKFGAYILAKLTADGIQAKFTTISQETRNSIALLHDGGKQTEILEKGPQISPQESLNFLQDFENLLDSVDLVTISGSLPQGLEKSFYNELIGMAVAKKVKILLDTSGDALSLAVKSATPPFLIKPNAAELGSLVNEQISDQNTQKVAAVLQSAVFAKIEWVSTSLGSNGAIVKYRNQLYRAEIPKVDAVSPVGSGDASLAGLAIGISQEKSPVDIIKTSMTLGMLNALESATGCVDPQKFQKYFDLVKVSKIN
jgi:tagatose 6-phosphate kinase